MTAPGPQTVEFRLSLGGVFSKAAPDLLKDGQYRFLQNVMAVQEGSISSRNGSTTLGQFSVGFAGVSQVRKLVITRQTDPLNDTINPRYLSIASRIYRTTNYAVPPAAVANISASRWEMASYSAGDTGQAWAFFATGSNVFAPIQMLKDSGANPYGLLHQWGILPAYGIASAVDSGAGGNPDGGASASPPGSQPYDYRYTYYSGDTNFEGNPSQAMLSNSAVANGTPVSVHLHSINVTVYGTDDPQVTQIFVYRRGGTLTDGIYRRVFQTINPGLGVTNTFADNVADSDLVFAAQLEFDNNPPVTSTVATPIRGTISNVAGSNPGRCVLTTTIPFATFAQITRGSQLLINSVSTNETCTVESVNPFTQQITTNTQLAHSNGDLVEVDAITGQSCSLAISYQDSILVAGDPNNPHVVYKSKTGQPEAFPVGSDASGAITQSFAGTPSNGILNMTEFKGQVLFLNVSALFETTVINGSIYPAVRVADKGIIDRDAWCKTDSEVWMVTTDGVYSWDGGSFRKRSEMIDALFHNEQLNGMAPVNLANPFIRMAFRRNQIHLVYQDITGTTTRIVCEPLYGDRWTPYTDTANPIAVIWTEPDTQGMVVIRETGANNTITIDDHSAVFGGVNYTSDLWLNGGDPRTSGFAINYAMRLPWFDMGDPASHKLFEEVFLDADPQLFANGVFPQASSMLVDLFLDYSDTVVETLTVAIPAGNSFQGRSLISILPQVLNRSGQNQSFGREARAISFQIRGSAYPTQPQFFRLLIKYQPTGELTAGRTSDWSDGGYPWDKRLQVMTVVFDTRGVNQQVMLDTMSGINGNTFNEGIAGPFVLANPVIDGNGRCTKVFPLSDALQGSAGMVAKLMRVRPIAPGLAGQTIASSFKILGVSFEFAKFPPDTVLFTEPKPFSDQEGIARVWRVRVDTGGIACALQLIGDGQNIGNPQSVTTSLDDWERILTPDSNLIARLWKMHLTPGNGGKAQLFDWSVDVVPEPPALTYWSSYQVNLGVDFYKFLKQCWLKYICASPLNVTFISDTGTFSVQLPSHAGRTSERFYFPTTFGAGLNKSRGYQINVQPATPGVTMRFYLDGSGIEYLVLGGDRHAAYQQSPLSELTALRAA